MNLIGFMAATAAFCLPAIEAGAEPSQLAARVGDTYEIAMNRDSSEQTGGDSSGSSHDEDTLLERVVGVRADGLELEYDLPKVAPPDATADNWQFPARIFKPYRGPLQLLNGSELEARVQSWLKTAKLTHEACGRWFFTWNAFQIECDPQSVIQAIERFDLRFPDLREGALYRDAKARDAGRLAKTVGPKGVTFTVEMAIDPDAVRRDRAQSDVVVAEIMGKPLTFDAALRERSNEAVSGTIEVTLDADVDGNVRQRTKVTKWEIRPPGKPLETQTVTETVVRRRLNS